MTNTLAQAIADYRERLAIAAYSQLEIDREIANRYQPPAEVRTFEAVADLIQSAIEEI